MNMNQRNAIFLLLIVSVLILACGSGQLFGLTATPLPSATATHTATPPPTETPTVVPTPTPISYDGQWNGMTAQNKGISFTVVDNGITEISFKAGLKGSGCTSEVETTLSFSKPLLIEDETFATGSDSGNASYTLKGSFMSADSISGALEYESMTGCPAKVEVDWSAVKGTESSSSVAPDSVVGIDEPIIVNEVNVQILETTWEEPVVVTGFKLKEGYRSLMITMKLQSDKTDSAADLMNKLSFREIAVVDDSGNESPIIYFNLPISSLTGSEYAQLDLYFAVLENTSPKSIRFVDGQVIDLASLLPPLK